jgi:hypothetical protein
VYTVNFNAEIAVFNAADGKLIHQASAGSTEDRQVRSMIVAAHGQLFLRTDTRLICFGKKR